MNYTTIAKVRSASGFADAVSPATPKITDATISSAITMAEGLINSKIGDVYIVPLSPVPSLIEGLATKMAKELLYSDEYGEETQNLDKGWQAKLDWAYNLLEEIRIRKLKLYIESGANVGDELPVKSLRSASFYPNAISEIDDNTTSKITINKKW